MAPQSVTHLEDEEESRHVFGLPDSTIAITRVNGDFNDSWYKWDLASRRRTELTNQMPH